MYHSKLKEVETLVNAGVSVLLEGEKGSGKTTIAQQVAEILELRFFAMSMTRQTTLSLLMGYMNVHGEYVSTLLRDAVENGGLFLLDEIDAADANVLLSLNTIENGYVSFPTGIVECHPDFRLIATANPQDQHDFYTGRSKLDAATLDRFDSVRVDTDKKLEQSLVDGDTFAHMELLRDIMKKNNVSQTVSMRDSLRYQKRKELNLLDGFIERLVQENHLVIKAYEERVEQLPKFGNQNECKTADELFELIAQREKNANEHS